MEEMLGAAGFKVVNLGYPSTEATVEGLLGYVDDAVAACGDDRVNFVTHSMGGILARGWLEREPAGANMGRVVMLAPPNQGSEVVDAFGELAIFDTLTGPAGLELGTGGRDAGAARAGRLRARGDRREPVGQPVVLGADPAADDGAVSVESTRVEGMADHIVLPVTHTFLMNNPLVIAQVAIFLETGKFDHGLTMGDLVRRVTGR